MVHANGQVSRPKGSVLVVNDHEATGQTVLQRLRARGFRVHAATTGRQALQVARLERPDIILFDMDPPALDAWESTRRLKTDPLTRNILVVAISEDSHTDRRNQAMRFGCDGFESKPIDVERLIESVERLLPAGA